MPCCKDVIMQAIQYGRIKSNFMKVWQFKEGVEINEVYDRVFLFYFDDPMLRAKVWLRGPWNCNKSLLVFFKVSDDGEIYEKDFQSIRFRYRCTVFQRYR